MSKNLRILKVLAILEGISYLLLLGVCMPLKYCLEILEPTKFVGMAHGLLFAAYCLWVLIVAREKQWSIKIILLAWVASILPFGPFVADKKLFGEEINTKMGSGD